MLNEIPVRCYAISAVVIRKRRWRKEVLMLRRATTLQGEWCQVAGGIEAGETAWQAAMREIKEETELVPFRLYSAETLEEFYEIDKDSIWVASVFVAFVRPEDQVRLNHEHIEYQWVSFRQAVSMVPFPGQKRVLRHVRSLFGRRLPTTHLRIPLGEGAIKEITDRTTD